MQWDKKNCHLETMKGREKWEEEVQQHYFSLIFKNADAIINKAQAVLVDARKFAGKPLPRYFKFLIVYLSIRLLVVF